MLTNMVPGAHGTWLAKIPTNGDIIAPILEKVEQIPIPTFLRLVGYNSGVNRKSVLNDPVTDIFPANVAITESKISVSSPSEK